VDRVVQPFDRPLDVCHFLQRILSLKIVVGVLTAQVQGGCAEELAVVVDEPLH
jgi:hypothetical protein